MAYKAQGDETRDGHACIAGTVHVLTAGFPFSKSFTAQCSFRRGNTFAATAGPTQAPSNLPTEDESRAGTCSLGRPMRLLCINDFLNLYSDVRYLGTYRSVSGVLSVTAPSSEGGGHILLQVRHRVHT